MSGYVCLSSGSQSPPDFEQERLIYDIKFRELYQFDTALNCVMTNISCIEVEYYPRIWSSDSEY